MTTDSYNGWTNRETWAVALHINNDQGWQASVREAVRNADDGFSQDPPIWAVYDNEAEEARDRATVAGNAIRENVEDTLDLLWQGRDNAREYGETVFSTVREDIGSLWRVNWSELGAAFLSDLAEDDA